MAPVLPSVRAALAAAIDRCAGPSLVFDLARIDARLAELASACRAAQITPLFAAKSFPHAAVRALAAHHLAGYDVASPGEVADAIALPGAAGRILSVADPSGRAAAAAAGWPGRLVVSCETVDQVARAPAHAEIAIRLSASLTGRDPAIGAVLDGSGRRRSRFGLDVAAGPLRTAIAQLARAAGDRPVGLHLHHGAVAATSGERFVATAQRAIAAAADAGVTPRFLDLGGAWHAVADLAGALGELRAAQPAPLELWIEPGRWIAERAGFATGRVLVARELDDRLLRVVELSRICHLRWSQPALVAAAPHPGAGRVTLWVGPTCYEDDVLGEWTVDPAGVPAGARVTFGNITGYALAWNTGFAGVAPADVVLVD